MKFTKRAIEAIVPTEKRQVFFDTEQSGLALRVGTSGRKTFYFTYRIGKGRSAPKKWLMLGVFPAMSVELARMMVRKKAAQVIMGTDPAEEIRKAKNVPRFADLFAEFLAVHGSKIKASSLRNYTAIAQSAVLPRFGTLKITDVTHAQIVRLHHERRDTPYQANRTVSVLCTFFNWCERVGYTPKNSNPARGVERYREEKRTRFMSQTEIAKLGEGLAKLEAAGRISIHAAAAVRVLLFTGARLREVLDLKWEYIHDTVAHLPDSKTGARDLILPPHALAVLNALPRISEYCFPSPQGSGRPLQTLAAPWAALCKAAGLTGWRIHDLRHAFASQAVNAGKSLPVIGKLLGHAQADTTARYAHVAANPMHQAAAETAAELQRVLTGGRILPFKKSA